MDVWAGNSESALQDVPVEGLQEIKGQRDEETEQITQWDQSAVVGQEGLLVGINKNREM